MKNPIWFETWGWIYRPTAMAGWLLVIIAGLFCVQIIGELFLASRSLNATFFVGFPYVVSDATLLMWIASKTSKK